MKSVFNALFTVYSWGFLVIAFPLHFVVAYVYSRFSSDPQYAHMRATRPFIWIGCRLVGIRLEIEGLENLPRDRAVMIVSNHQSLFDILVHLSLLPVNFSFIAKKELLKVPILGADMRFQGHIAIDREDTRAAQKTLKDVKACLASGRSVLGFAEGTRSKDSTILPFKRGLFMVAIAAGVPVVPVYISGTANVIKKKEFTIRPGTVRVSIGVPIDPALGQSRDVNLLRDRTRDAILAMQAKQG